MRFKVLLIEDEELTRNLLKKVLKKEGYDVIVADNGKNGLDLFNLEKPDIVVTDIKMPGLDGKEVLYRIKRLDPSTEVILITGHGDLDTVIHALREGALDYIKKPINFDQLLLSLGRAKEKITKARNIIPKTNLLIIEDDQNTREKLAQIFRKEGFETLTGADGEEGINIFMQNKVDILLVDVKMPKKNGLEVLHEVRKYSDDCEVIMLTGYSDEEAAVQAMRDGAINFIRKPLDIEQLIVAVQKAIEKLHLQRSFKYNKRELELSQEIIAKILNEKEIIIELRENSSPSIRNFVLDLINALPVSLFLVDDKMNIESVNNTAIQAYNYLPEQIDEMFIDKLNLQSIGLVKLINEINEVFKFKGIKVFILENDANKLIMVRVVIIADKQRKEKVILIFGDYRKVQK